MATVSRLSIMIDANASGVAKGLAPVEGQLKQFQASIAGAISGATNRAGTVLATFLTVEKVIGRIKRAFAEIEQLGPLLRPQELANVNAMRDTWQEINREIDLTILRVGGELAPAFIVALKNAEALLAPLVSASGAIKGIGGWVTWLGAQWANLQGIVSGIFLYWQSAADWIFGQWLTKLEMVKVALEQVSMTDLFDNDDGVNNIRNEVERSARTMAEAQKMLEGGLSGQAGRDFIAQVEKERAAIKKASETAQKEQGKVAEAAIRAQMVQPGAFSLGSSAATSAINAALREQDGSKKILLDQLKELRKIAAQKTVTLAPANL
jgi:hypothetical protein